MLGAIIGDIVGSRFEWENYKGKDFELFTKECMPTDDSIMSLAIGAGLLKSQPDYENLEKNTIDCMQSLVDNILIVVMELTSIFGSLEMIQSLIIVMVMVPR